MSKLPFSGLRSLLGARSLFPSEYRLVPLLLCLFLTGAAAGCFAGVYLLPTELQSGLAGELAGMRETAFPESLWNASRFFLALLLLATSWLGVAGVPGLLALRGYLLGCSAAALYVSGSWHGLLAALLLSGIPALMTLPSLFALACDACSASQRLLSMRFSEWAALPTVRIVRRLLPAVCSVVLEALYRTFLLPLLLPLL